ncbi:MAG: bacillithiol biosynthesis cysteine-adding enzyme BshC [Vicinamibacterales bacterium]
MSADPSTTAASGAATRLAVDVRRFAWVRPLAGDYAFNFGNIAALYAGDPQSADAWRETAVRVQRHHRSRRDVAACVAAQQDRRGAPAAARTATERLTDPRALAVVTGQQAGAFGGPLFTILKAITAIQLARRAETTLGCPTIAGFWVDAEDHDWDEVAGCTVLDPHLQPRTIILPAPEGAGELPVAALRLDERVRASVDDLEAALARTDYTTWAIEGIRTSYRPGAGMADAFACWLESLLGLHGLVVFDSSDPAIKPLLADVFSRELTTPGRTSALAVKAGEALAARGHSPQVMPQPDSVSLFRLDGARHPIRRQGDQFVIGDQHYSAASLADEAAASPQRFSPNVLLRPIAQDTLFPTICYVAGPSELAYLGQLREAYDHFGVPMPLIYPRATATVVDSATARFLARYDVPLEDLQRQDESALNRLLETQLPPSVEAAMKEADDTIRRAMHQVIEVMPGVDPTLAGAAKNTLGKIEHEVRALHGKLIQAVKKRDETLRRQFTRAQAQTFPQGHPQERVLAGVHFLNLYGPALIERLLQELPLDLGTHWVISI